jgi:hypothetical protein
MGVTFQWDVDKKSIRIISFLRAEKVEPMGKKDVLAKVLAVTGTAATWVPLLAPVVLTGSRLIQRGSFLFDWLIPAELFLLVLVGGALLLWAAKRARRRVKLIAWGLGLAVLILFAAQGLAMASGLASGTADPNGFWFGLVVALILTYILAVILLGVGGILLCRDLFARRRG